MLETTGDESHNGWTIKTRSAKEIESKIAVARWGDNLGAAIDGSPKRYYNYHVIRYRTDEAYVTTRSDIQTRPWRRARSHRKPILSHPQPIRERGMFDVKSRTRLGKLG